MFVTGFIVPTSIQDAYNNLQPHIQIALKNGSCDISDADFQSISPVLLNLLPVRILYIPFIMYIKFILSLMIEFLKPIINIVIQVHNAQFCTWKMD